MSRSPEHLKIDSREDEASAKPVTRTSHPSGTVRVAITVLATIAVLWALQWGSEFLIPFAVALCMTFWLMPLVDRLAHWKIPRSLGSAIVLIGLICGLGSVGFALRDDAHDFA